MRILRSIAVACACGVLLAGCGDSEEDAGSALDEALRHFPADSPFVAVIDTDPESGQPKQALELLRRFPFADQLLEGAASDALGGEGGFDDDVRPLLGNELVAGIPAVGDLESSESVDIVAVLQVEDGGKLRELIEDSGLEEAGESHGATVYEDDSGEAAVAIEDDVAVFGRQRGDVDAALERRDGDGQLTEEEFAKSQEGLPEEALARFGGNVEAALERTGGGEQARKVPFIAGLRRYGAALTVSGDGLALAVRAGVEDLEAGENLLASNAEPPDVIGDRDEVAIGLREPDHVIRFAEAAGRAVMPELAQLDLLKRQLSERIGSDVDQLIAGLETVAVAIDPREGFRARVEVASGARVERALDGLAEDSPIPGLEVRPGRRGRPFTVEFPGGERVYAAVTGNVLYLARTADGIEQTRAEEPRQVEGAEGAFALELDAGALAESALEQAGGEAGLGALFGASFLRPLGLVTGSLLADESGLRGRLRLEIEE